MGTVGMRRPPTCDFKVAHAAGDGQQESPGRQRHAGFRTLASPKAEAASTATTAASDSLIVSRFLEAGLSSKADTDEEGRGGTFPRHAAAGS